MDVTGPNAIGQIGQVYAVRVEKLAQNIQKAQGEAAVQLIQEAGQPPPPGLNGEGSRINTYG